MIYFVNNPFNFLLICRIKGHPNDYISAANDSVKNFNAKMIPKNGLPVLVSIKDIHINEEISYNYTRSTTTVAMPWREIKV